MTLEEKLEKFKSRTAVLNTPTQEIFDRLMIELEKRGYKWRSGRVAGDNSFDRWGYFKEMTCVSNRSDGMYYCDRAYYESEGIAILEMLLARRRIMMAKKKPSFHVWDGTRDYSFFNTGASTWYIDTPEKWAALCMISLNMDVADGSGLSNARDTMRSKNIEVTEGLYFNENYTEDIS